MALRFYLMPATVMPNNSRPEKYRLEMIGQGIEWSTFSYGTTLTFLIGALVNAAQHTFVDAFVDVDSFPADLDAALTPAERNTLEAMLEAHNIPGDWVQAAAQVPNARFVVRVLLGICFISQRFKGFDQLAGGSGDLFQQGVTLNTQYSAMPLDYRARLVDAVTSLTYTVPIPVPPAATLRSLLRSIGGQQVPVPVMGVTV